MRKSYRQYEILLPRWSNEHQPISDVRGLWEHSGQIFSDDLIRIFVDVVDNNENQQFFEQFQREPQDAVRTNRHLDDHAFNRSHLTSALRLFEILHGNR